MAIKTAIQIRILRKYGFLPVFEGEVDFTNVKSAKKGEKETFSSWCERVLGKDSNEVFLYGLYQPPGQKHVENLSDDGQLMQLFRSNVQRVLQKKLSKQKELGSDNDFCELEQTDDELLFSDKPQTKVEPWYVKLKNIKTPECLDSKNLLLSDHSDNQEYSESYGDAARHLIVLNDMARYAEDLKHIFSDSEFEKTYEALEELERFADEACEIDALMSDLEDVSDCDKHYVEREHIKLIITYMDGLFDAINLVKWELQDELESLSDSEQFIGELMLDKPVSALRRCADMLYEL